jgi:hypothetical protein
MARLKERFELLSGYGDLDLAVTASRSDVPCGMVVGADPPATDPTAKRLLVWAIVPGDALPALGERASETGICVASGCSLYAEMRHMAPTQRHVLSRHQAECSDLGVFGVAEANSRYRLGEFHLSARSFRPRAQHLL